MRTLSHGSSQVQQSNDMESVMIYRVIEARYIHTGVQHAHHGVHFWASRANRCKDLSLSRNYVWIVNDLLGIDLLLWSFFFLVVPNQKLGAYFSARFHFCLLPIDLIGKGSRDRHQALHNIMRGNDEFSRRLEIRRIVHSRVWHASKRYFSTCHLSKQWFVVFATFRRHLELVVSVLLLRRHGSGSTFWRTHIGRDRLFRDWSW